MTDLTTTLRVILIISILLLIAWFLYIWSKQQRDNVREVDSGGPSPSLTKAPIAGEGSKRNGLNDSQSSDSQKFLETRNELKDTLNSQPAGKSPDISQPFEGDRQLLSDVFSKLKEQNEVLNQIKDQMNELKAINSTPYGFSDELLGALKQIPTILSIIQSLQLSESRQTLSQNERQFFEQEFSQLAAQLGAKMNSVLTNSVQIDEIRKALDSQNNEFLRKLREVLDAHGYKECVNCQSEVPKNAKFCPQCGENPDKKSTAQASV